MKILIIKTSSLGDILHTFPALAHLRRRYPGAKIDWVVERRCSELVYAHPKINEVIEIDSRRWRKSPSSWKEIFALRKKNYDLAIDFQGNLKSGLLIGAACAKEKVGFGRKSVPEWPNLLFTRTRFNPPPGQNIRLDYLHLVQGVFEEEAVELRCKEEIELPSSQRRKILVCPGAAWPTKELKLDAFTAFLRRYTDADFFFSWGSERELARAKTLSAELPGSQILPRISLPALQQVMSRVDLVVAMDSLPLHLCATTHTPSVSFFGPSLGSKYAPLGKRHTWFQGACPYGIEFEKRCPKLRTCPTGACLNKAD